MLRAAKAHSFRGEIMRLGGKTAIITGGASGIGRGICLRFAEEGANIVVADLNHVGADETADRLREQGHNCLSVYADVSDQADVLRLFERTLEHFGSYEILVNNAGILASFTNVADLTEEQWDRTMKVNLKSMYLCSQQAARYWVRERKFGRIVNLGSANSDYALPDLSDYCASKGAIKAFTRAAAVDLAQYGITVNAIGPGGTQTNITSAFLDPENIPKMDPTIPLGRVAQPLDQANVALFLASDEASYITGELVLVTGGRSARF